MFEIERNSNVRPNVMKRWRHVLFFYFYVYVLRLYWSLADRKVQIKYLKTSVKKNPVEIVSYKVPLEC